MLKNVKKISILLLTSIFLFSSVEANWITKKSDKPKEVIKEEKKQKSKWIKLKKKEIKKNKEDYKKKEKNISNEVKSWITKKVKKDKFLDINSLPDSQIYFTASASDGRIFYGYINDDKKSDKITFNGNSIYKISKGKGYIQNSKSICNIATERGVIANTIIGYVFGECSDKTKFTGQYSQKNKSGSAETAQKIKINFNFNENLKSTKTEIAKLNEAHTVQEKTIARHLPNNTKVKISLKPNGKYYALLIGNSNYDNNGWDDLVSPINDINAIKSVLDKSFKFEKIMMVKDGTKKEIFKAFQDLSKLTTTNDYVLVYYSGHGMVKAKQAYWIPKDGSLEWGNGDWININELNIFLTEIKAHHLALMVDSCYVGGKFKGINVLEIDNNEDRPIINELLEDYLNLRSRSVLSSGSNGQVSDTAPNSNNSIFALSFLNMLNISESQSSPMNMRTIAFNLANAFAGNYNQKPYYYHPDTWKHLGGDFIFIPKKNLK
jgi:hypothetical protein